MAEKLGRPTGYNQEIAHEICEIIANTSKGLKKLSAENEHWPDSTTIRRWIQANEEFCRQYARAKLLQADYMAEEILEISDDGSNDFMADKDGNQRLDGEHVQRSRLRVDTRKWLAAKLAPKIYGDKQETNHGVADGSLMKKLIDKL